MVELRADQVGYRYPKAVADALADVTVDFRHDAETVATVLGMSPSEVQPLPSDLASEVDGPLANAMVVVWLGPDLAVPGDLDQAPVGQG